MASPVMLAQIVGPSAGANLGRLAMTKSAKTIENKALTTYMFSNCATTLSVVCLS